MSPSEFQKHLDSKSYKYEVKPCGVVVTHKGYVYLRSLTTLPAGIKFENAGSVYLDSLTTLPAGIKFENAGSVYLRSLTTLPAGIKFENKGNVDLDSLTTLPAGIKFENAGNVDLRSLSGLIQYRGRNITIRNIDGYTMIMLSSKKRGEITLSSARYFQGGEIADMKSFFIASRGDFHAHGDTARDAIDDVNFKFMQDHADVDGLVASIKSKNSVSRHEYRLLTGACREGVEHFIAERGINPELDALPLDQVLKITKGAFGGSRMRELFT